MLRFEFNNLESLNEEQELISKLRDQHCHSWSWIYADDSFMNNKHDVLVIEQHPKVIGPSN